MKVSPYLRRTTTGYMHWCPGCGSHHVFYTDAPLKNGARWTFDGNTDRPTFSPSMLSWTDEVVDEDGDTWPATRCHYFLKAGKIQYLADCTHELAGTTIDLPVLPGG